MSRWIITSCSSLVSSDPLFSLQGGGAVGAVNLSPSSHLRWGNSGCFYSEAGLPSWSPVTHCRYLRWCLTPQVEEMDHSLLTFISLTPQASTPDITLLANPSLDWHVLFVPESFSSLATFQEEAEQTVSTYVCFSSSLLLNLSKGGKG